jgi:hypothetical protein
VKVDLIIKYWFCDSYSIGEKTHFSGDVYYSLGFFLMNMGKIPKGNIVYMGNGISSGSGATLNCAFFTIHV